jgi:hypothetical protein
VELQFENGISANRFLNQDSIVFRDLESMLLRDHPQNPFSTASTRLRSLFFADRQSIAAGEFLTLQTAQLAALGTSAACGALG